MIDAVLSWHTDPMTCGVAKFGIALAQRLGVRFGPVNPRDAVCPLFSLKCAEVPQNRGRLHPPYALFLHDSPVTARDWEWVGCADRVYAANQVIATDLRQTRPDVIEAFCPSTVDGCDSRGAYRVLTFGMAHKLVLPHFEALKTTLERDHPDYTIELSTAVHEGSPWDEALRESTTAMRGIFGARLRVLGFLGDDALARALVDCDAVAAYFTPAFRANNTSAWAAIDAGKTLYTNTDEHSPPLTMDHSWERLLQVLA